jgi:hypothetical protein
MNDLEVGLDEVTSEAIIASRGRLGPLRDLVTVPPTLPNSLSSSLVRIQLEVSLTWLVPKRR